MALQFLAWCMLQNLDPSSKCRPVALETALKNLEDKNNGMFRFQLANGGLAKKGIWRQKIKAWNKPLSTQLVLFSCETQVIACPIMHWGKDMLSAIHDRDYSYYVLYYSTAMNYAVKKTLLTFISAQKSILSFHMLEKPATLVNILLHLTVSNN